MAHGSRYPLGQADQHAGASPRKPSYTHRAAEQFRLGRHLYPDGFQGEGTFLQARRERRFPIHGASSNEECADWPADD